MAAIKVCDPVPVPLSILEELRQLRAELAQLRQDQEQLRQDNQRVREQNSRLQAELDQARRQSKRQAAPFSKGAELGSYGYERETAALLRAGGAEPCQSRSECRRGGRRLASTSAPPSPPSPHPPGPGCPSAAPA
jgi:hypothetical protein